MSVQGFDRAGVNPASSLLLVRLIQAIETNSASDQRQNVPRSNNFSQP